MHITINSYDKKKNIKKDHKCFHPCQLVNSYMKIKKVGALFTKKLITKIDHKLY